MSAPTVLVAVPPTVQTAPLTGDPVDCAALGTALFATQQIGAFEESNTWTGKIQESSDGATNWTDISGGAFAAVTEGQSNQTIALTRTKQYVRYAGALVGSTANFSLAVLVGEVPAATGGGLLRRR